ncbi:hypothetical protein [Blastomonas sp. CCH5-A3]|jgi:hypothetical protein|uniref:hypothetical protein n=1 Tax=Blastomonas sp. CCH5-A3 TaxID=1768761 RepID=UPI0008262E13|nr:hypothetical protein [Blastomonas sp. CCH5-A3]
MDSLATQIVECGLAASTFLLDLNRSLTVPRDFPLPYPWDLPSRLFQFPIEVSADNGDGTCLGLMHPLLAAHPFVQHVEATLGLKLDTNGAPNAYGVSKARNGQWWHAVDLVSAGQWRALLDTREYTSAEDIARAVAYGLTYSRHDGKPTGYLTTPEARAIMAAIGAPEPASRRGALAFSAPSACKPDTGAVHWPVNHPGLSVNDVAWALIHGIQDGWFAHDRSGFLHWTEQGRERHATGEAGTFTTTSGQGAFAF